MFIRCGLRDGVFPFGYAVKMSSRWTYVISEHQVKKFLGMEDNEDGVETSKKL